MDWSQVMKAMLEGKKVRGEYFDANTWISAENSTSCAFFSYSELQAMEWEIYAEENTELVTATNNAHRLLQKH